MDRQELQEEAKHCMKQPFPQDALSSQVEHLPLKRNKQTVEGLLGRVDQAHCQL